MDLSQAIPQKGGGISMKKGWKVFWIVSAILLALGFVCCIASVALGVTTEMIESRLPDGVHLVYDNPDHEDDEESSGTTLEGNSFQSFDGIREIDMAVGAGNVEIVSAPEGTGEVTVKTESVDKRLKLQCYMDGDELKIHTRKELSGLTDIKEGKIQISIPSDCVLGDVSIDVGAGKLYVEKILADYIGISVGAGEAKLAQFAVKELSMECGAGSIEASGEVREEADIECGMGEINYTAFGEEMDYNYGISCGIGEVVLGSKRFSGLGREADISNGASKNMFIECGIGSVAVNFSEGL